MIVLVLAPAPSVVAAGAPNESPIRVTGTAKDALGRPIDGASVSMQNSAGKIVARAASNSSGAFNLEAPGIGVYAVVATKPGFKPATRILTLTRTAPKPVEIAMESVAALSLPVVARRLDKVRNSLSPVTGGSIYTFTEKALRQLPQGNNTPLNQVLLQAPGVAQDSYGQLHVRGDHGNLQYRLNGVLLPEGVTGFGQILTPRFARDISLLTGALPAQYGLRTAGVVDIKTKDGLLDSVSNLDFYGGQRGTTQPSFEFGGSKGNFSYFATGQYYGSDRGLEPPTTGPTAIHDTTNQGSGFGYFSYFLSPTTRLSLITGTAVSHFQIPANPNQVQAFQLAGVPTYPSAKIRENQFEQNYFGVLTLQGEVGASFDYQIAPFSRYSSVSFNPDHVGDLIYNGAASKVLRSDWASGFQLDTSYRGVAHHTLRLGGSFWGERAEIDNHESIFRTDSSGAQSSNVPFSITANHALTSWYYSGYLQDEWKPIEKLTINYGARFDLYDGLVRADQLSPRIGVVYTPFKHTTLHAAYARYFTPPPTELVSIGSIKAFQNTTGAPPSNGNGNPTAERDHYFDAGITQEILPRLNVGIDSFYKKASQLLDEGQFGPALIFTNFNYDKGRVYGVEFTSSYNLEKLTTYANFTYSVGQGTQVTSGQFNFDRNELKYIGSHYVFLDHDQTFSASAGAAYTWNTFMFTIDGIYGSGLRSGFANTGNLPYYIQLNAGITKRIEMAQAGALVLRGAIVNLNDRTYLIRNGTGIGVGAPQYGPRRALYAGITWELPFNRPSSPVQ
ncbi:MAG: TonB-dependent receptor [Candidatus Binatus sp.]|nr:TonB-dependent receptor [Candidatus Binatus sp.]MDO8433635.1 TonB-dependent receptor [Candidatus Binatus sp.]